MRWLVALAATALHVGVALALVGVHVALFVGYALLWVWLAVTVAGRF